jgi:tetratricopeptide (TPR) repeat protein
MASSGRIDELRKKFEENPRRYFAPLANEYRKAGDVDEAIAICREYLPQQPGHMSGHIVYGQALYEGRQFEEAKTVFETALSLDPENLIALRHLGDIALILGDTDGAKSWYGRVLEADPRNEEIQAQLKSLDSTPAFGSGAESPDAAVAVEAAAGVPPTGEAAASSAATVVVSAMKLPDVERTVEQQAFSLPETPPPTPQFETLSSAPTAEITLDNVPAPAMPELQNISEPLPAAESTMAMGFEPTAAGGDVVQSPSEPLLDVPLTTPSDNPTPLDSFTLEGLETTSIAGDGPPSAAPLLSAADKDVPPVELLQLDAPSATPSPEMVMESATPLEERAAEGLTPAEPTAEGLTSAEPTADLPMLDLSETVPATPPAPVTPPVALDDAPAAGAERSEPAEPGPFVTETMAELYLSQGHRDEALRVYRALVDQRPDDEALRAKLARMLADSGPTIRELLATVAKRRPGSGGAVQSSAAPVESGDEAASPPKLQQPVEANARTETAPSASAGVRDDRFAGLFGGVTPSDDSERAARVLSSAFSEAASRNGSGETSVAGQPAHPASKDLSLDAVFGSESREPTPSTFSFDQFFSQRASAQGAGPAAGTSGGQESRDDVAKFTQWLEGLKQR